MSSEVQDIDQTNIIRKIQDGDRAAQRLLYTLHVRYASNKPRLNHNHLTNTKENMIRNTILALFAVASLSACYRTMPINNTADMAKLEQQSADIPFTEADHYFVKNTVKEVPAKITSQAQLEKYFGMAAVMGEGGLPTSIDFTKQFAIAVDMPDTNIDTELIPVSLKKDGKKLLFIYKVKKGEQRSYTTHPFTLIIVSKEYDAKVSLQAM